MFTVTWLEVSGVAWNWLEVLVHKDPRDWAEFGEKELRVFTDEVLGFPRLFEKTEVKCLLVKGYRSCQCNRERSLRYSRHKS